MTEAPAVHPLQTLGDLARERLPDAVTETVFRFGELTLLAERERIVEGRRP